MALYDGYEDEETRRQRREDELSPYNNGAGDPGASPPNSYYPGAGNDGYGDPTDGIGSPESGYGIGGVDNPAYQNPWTMDMVNAAGAAEANYLNGPPAPAQTTVAPPAPQPAAFQPPATPSSYTPWTTQQGPQMSSVSTPAITNEVTRLLQARLKELSNPGDVASDPIYQQAVRQHQIAALRSADRQRKALAERTGATGGTTRSGGFNVGVQGILERSGENAAQYRSGLALDRLQAREQQLVQAIQIARAIGQDDMANQLELQRLALQKELGMADLGLRAELGRGQLGLGYDNLGFNYADLIERANRNATIAALGGA